jgi:hypothetical protein
LDGQLGRSEAAFVERVQASDVQAVMDRSLEVVRRHQRAGTVQLLAAQQNALK